MITMILAMTITHAWALWYGSVQDRGSSPGVACGYRCHHCTHAVTTLTHPSHWILYYHDILTPPQNLLTLPFIPFLYLLAIVEDLAHASSAVTLDKIVWFLITVITKQWKQQLQPTNYDDHQKITQQSQWSEWPVFFLNWTCSLKNCGMLV